MPGPDSELQERVAWFSVTLMPLKVEAAARLRWLLVRNSKPWDDFNLQQL